MPITEKRKNHIEKWMIQMWRENHSEERIEHEMDDWTVEDQAYFRHVSDNWEPDELEEMLDGGR